ncbi:MAG: sigma-70 family RNA polymerase sigma factor [Ignavibacteriales bacterium]|nr:MAG: sigma-70 family RNA polymerase sigma factor [Ignavibacteriales bacterium]
MKKVTGKDKKALETLYSRYSPTLFPLLLKILKNERIAEETLVDIFVIIWRRAGSFNFGQENVYAWIIGIARNKAVDLLRRNSEDNTIEEYTEDYETRYILPVLSSGLASMDYKAAVEYKSKITDAFNELTDAQRYVIELAFFDGLTESEIAQRLNIPLPTVQSKIKIALNNLNEFLLKSRKKQ